MCGPGDIILQEDLSYKECSRNHLEYDNKCPYCVAVNGYKVKTKKRGNK